MSETNARRRGWGPRVGVRAMLLLVACAATFFALARALSSGLLTNRSLWELRYGSAQARRFAAEDLTTRSARSPAATSALFDAANDRDAGVRARAVHALAMIQPPLGQLMPVLVRAMSDADPSVRMEAARAATFMAPYEDHVPPLLKALDDPDARVRAVAANSLGYFKPAWPTVVAKLSARLDDSASAVSEAALQSLGRIVPVPGDLLPLALQASRSTHAGTRALAAQLLNQKALLTIPVTSTEENLLAQAIDALAKMQDDPSLSVRVAATAAICGTRKNVVAAREPHVESVRAAHAIGKPVDRALGPLRRPGVLSEMSGSWRLVGRFLLAIPLEDSLVWLAERRLDLSPDARALERVDARLDPPMKRMGPILSAGIADRDSQVSQLAAGALVTTPLEERDGTVTSGFLKALRERIEELREPETYWMLLYLSENGPALRRAEPKLSADIDAICRAIVPRLQPGVPDYQVEAAKALAALGRGAELAVPALKTLLEIGQADMFVRSDRQEILEALIALSSQLERDDPAIRAAFDAVVPVLVEVDEIECLEALCPHLDSAAAALARLRSHPDARIRKHVAERLKGAGEPWKHMRN